MSKLIWTRLLVLAGLMTFQAGFAKAADPGGLKLSSPVFKQNDFIPTKYTCDGSNISPPLVIENVPTGAKSMALIADDPDAPRGTWTHWVAWNIPPEVKEFAEASAPSGAAQGMSDFRKPGYGGPCPPSGTHRYFFKLYALDTTLLLNANTTAADLERAMKGHILEKTALEGRYSR
jgi:Raf kinase inhibitor-like YbhB/YbcL family protein